MHSITPDARLTAAAEFVRQGARLADVGTDHAYLPVSLLRQGVISFAVASDISEGPLAHARETAAIAGIGEDRLRLVCTDGLTGLDTYGLTDIAICGMGGEGIAKILAAALFVRDPAIRLILQPMTRGFVLRRYLAENGFKIERENLACVRRHVYACLCVSFTGEPYSLTPIEAVLGAYHIGEGREHPLFPAYLREHLDAVRRRTTGLRTGGYRDREAAALQTEMEKYL